MVDEALVGSIDPGSLVYVQAPATIDHLACPICKLPFIEPYSTVCGHTFCKQCLLESLRSVLGKKCPLDRIPLAVPASLLDESGADGVVDENIDSEMDSDIFPAPIILTNMTEDLSVHCLNQSSGCAWVGPRWSLKVHVAECEYSNIVCQCGEFVERRLYKEDRCVHKEVECVNCQQLVCEIDMEEHLNSHCEGNLQKCSGCQLSFPKMHLQAHEDKCPKMHLQCPGAPNGCNWRGQRELLLTIHQEECVFIKLSAKFAAIDSSMMQLAEENSALKLQISSILNAVVSGKIQNLGYSFGEDDEVKELERTAPQQGQRRGSPLKFPLGKVRMMVGELDLNRRLTETLVQENVALREEIANQRAVLTTVRQQMQYILLDRHRKTSKSADNIDNMRLSTKL